jgi:nucleoside-diphosphate-sugar epimerase
MLKQPIALLLACGKLSQRVGTDLLRQGYRVIAVRRNPPQNSELEWISADLTDASAIAALPEAVELLIYTPSPSRQQPDSYQLMYAQLATQLVQRYQRSTHLRRALLISSTRVYEERGGEWVDENTPVQAASSQSQSVIDAEKIWLTGFPEQGCVLRLAGIYGPGREWQIRRLLAQQPIQFAPPSYTNRIHEQDAANLMTFLLRQPSLPYDLYLGVDDDPVAEGELFRWLADKFKTHVPPALTGASQQNKRCSNARIKSLGFLFDYPSFREGYSAILATGRFNSGDV